MYTLEALEGSGSSFTESGKWRKRLNGGSPVSLNVFGFSTWSSSGGRRSSSSARVRPWPAFPSDDCGDFAVMLSWMQISVE